MEKVLIVDDDSVSQKFLAKHLKDHYQVEIAGSGEEGIRLAESFQPSTILLDVEMPGLNGYETCTRLKKSQKTKHIPVLFISGKSSIEERVEGYDAGGEDYLVKPPEKKELLAKVAVSIRNYQRQLELGSSIDLAEKMVQVALRGQGDMGSVIHFTEKLSMVTDLETLANKVLILCQEYGLSTVVSLRDAKDQVIYYSSHGETTSLERQIMSMVSLDQRFFDFGKRTLINYPRVSVLLKNMPLEDMEKYGRIKDLLPPVIAAANTHLLTIENRRNVHELNSLIHQSVHTIDSSLQVLKDSIKSRLEENHSLIESHYFQVEAQVPFMGLDEDQEHFILKVMDETLERSKRLSESRQEAEDTFDHISLLLHTIEEKEDLLEKLANEQICSESEAPYDMLNKPEGTGESSVDLF